jgi:hypothetical protein
LACGTLIQGTYNPPLWISSSWLLGKESGW